MSILKNPGGRKKTNTTPTTIRLDADLHRRAQLHVLQSTGSTHGLASLINKALEYWMEPKSWLLIVGTESEGIIVTSHHVTEGRANGKRLNMRITWNKAPIDGVFYGETKDTPEPAWAIVKQLELDKQ